MDDKRGTIERRNKEKKTKINPKEEKANTNEEEEDKNLCRNLRFRQLGALASGRKLNQEI